MSVATLSTNTITLQRKTPTQDATGGKVESWVPVGSYRCSIQPLGAKEVALYQREGSSITHKVYVAGAPDIRHTDRFTFKGKTYNIRGVRNPDERNWYLTIHAELID